MEVFTESLRQQEEIGLPESPHLKEAAEDLAFLYGINIRWIASARKITTIAELMIQIAQRLAWNRERSAESQRAANLFSRLCKDFDSTYFNKSVSILGSGLIVEALAKHFSMLEWSIRAINSSETEMTDFEPGECFIFAGAALLKGELLQNILEVKPAYVGLVDNFSYATKLIEQIELDTDSLKKYPLFIPAGIDIGSTNPYEVGLSVVAEILLQLRNERQN